MTSLPILGLAAILPPIVLFAASIADGGHGLWNDFTSYWLAGRLVAAGETPYDIAALAALGAREGIVFEVGTGYSYPLPFAVAMVPLSALSFTLAASLFTAASLLLFGLAVASWLRDERVWRAGPAVTLGAALAAGLYTPVHGSLFFGQANLLVFAGLALGVRLWLGGDRRRDVIGGIWIGLVGILKVAPLALALPLLLARRVGGLVGIGAGAAGAMLAAAALAPSGLLGMDRLVRLGEPDPYWTNQSINGFASRLTIGSDRVVAILPGVDARLLGSVLLVLFGIASIVVLVRSRRLLEPSVWIGLAIALALVGHGRRAEELLLEPGAGTHRRGPAPRADHRRSSRPAPQRARSPGRVVRPRHAAMVARQPLDRSAVLRPGRHGAVVGCPVRSHRAVGCDRQSDAAAASASNH